MANHGRYQAAAEVYLVESPEACSRRRSSGSSEEEERQEAAITSPSGRRLKPEA